MFRLCLFILTSFFALSASVSTAYAREFTHAASMGKLAFRYAQAPPSSIDRDAAPGEPQKNARAKDAGVLDGRVSAVDYQRGVLTVQAAGRPHVDVVVLPSTSIQGEGDGFHTIADIAKGAHVEILMSRRGDVLTAQVIRLRP